MATIGATAIRGGLVRIAAALSVASLIAVAMPSDALANPVLRVSDGVTTVDIVDGSPQDDVAAPGVILYQPESSPFADWNLIVETGGSLLLTDPDRVDQFLNVVAGSTAASTLQISISEAGLLVPGGILTAIGSMGFTTLPGVSNATLDLFIDLGNDLFAETMQLFSVTGGGAAYNADIQTYFAAIDAPFSMTLKLTLEHSGVSLTTGGALATVLPEPATTALFGLGLLGLGLLRRRFR